MPQQPRLWTDSIETQSEHTQTDSQATTPLRISEDTTAFDTVNPPPVAGRRPQASAPSVVAQAGGNPLSGSVPQTMHSAAEQHPQTGQYGAAAQQNPQTAPQPYAGAHLQTGQHPQATHYSQHGQQSHGMRPQQAGGYGVPGGYQPTQPVTMQGPVVPPATGEHPAAKRRRERPDPAARPLSGVAVAGFITSIFVPPIGLVLSLFGLGTTSSPRVKGRGFAIAGSLIGIILTAALVFVGMRAYAVAKPIITLMQGGGPGVNLDLGTGGKNGGTVLSPGNGANPLPLPGTDSSPEESDEDTSIVDVVPGDEPATDPGASEPDTESSAKPEAKPEPKLTPDADKPAPTEQPKKQPETKPGNAGPKLSASQQAYVNELVAAGFVSKDSTQIADVVQVGQGTCMMAQMGLDPKQQLTNISNISPAMADKVVSAANKHLCKQV